MIGAGVGLPVLVSSMRLIVTGACALKRFIPGYSTTPRALTVPTAGLPLKIIPIGSDSTIILLPTVLAWTTSSRWWSLAQLWLDGNCQKTGARKCAGLLPYVPNETCGFFCLHEPGHL